MRILAVLSLITATFFSLMVVATKAEAQCLLCGVVGFTLSSTSNDEQAGTSSGSNVIYVAPHIGERISDPLAVRVASSPRMEFQPDPRDDSYAQPGFGITLEEIFAATVPEHQRYVILEIVRVLQAGDNQYARFWFAYIENEKMRPLLEFPSN